MIKPSSPYSASKASSDMLVKSYFHTYGLDVVISNCSNNYGPNQHDEKLIPTIIRNVLSGNKIPIYGDGKNVRDWLYVLDHCKGIDRVYHSGISGETYNIGGNDEKNNIEIVLLICDVLNRELDKDFSYDELIKYVSDRPGHDKRYAIDASKIRNELNFSPETSFKDGLSETVKWYIQKYLKDTKK
jgi:dTDP-glucose 4,6-dehydratase